MNKSEKTLLGLAAMVIVFTIAAGICYDSGHHGMAWACAIVAGLSLCGVPATIESL